MSNSQTDLKINLLDFILHYHLGVYFALFSTGLKSDNLLNSL